MFSSSKKMAPSWAKGPTRKLILQYRRATWRGRSLPDFLIIGAQKSGTSSLYSYLSQHPQLVPSFEKEVHFFDGGLDPNVDSFEQGSEWYRAFFPLRSSLGTKSKTFEASPLYMFNPLAPKRIFDLIPDVKLIAVLRNPAERAISHYFHEKRKGREALPILQALRAEECRLQSVADNKDYKNHSFIHYSYKSRGLYRQQIDRFLSYFPMERILLLSSDEVFNQPASCLGRLFGFVGVDPQFKIKDLKPRNVADNKTDVAPDVREYLDEYFSPHNQALYELVGKDLGW